MRGLLDPKQVASDAYFGNTAHSEGDMVSFVSDDFVDEEVWEQSDKEAVSIRACGRGWASQRRWKQRRSSKEVWT